MSGARHLLLRATCVALLAFACRDAEPEAPADAPPEAPAAERPAPEPPPDASPAPAPAPPPAPVPAPAPPPALPPAAPPTPEAAPAPTPAAQTPSEAPALSLDELGRRIKETKAIGVFTKLALKNDIDDLLEAMGAYHERGEGRLDALRERYEALVLKLSTLLEKNEPALATALARSREDIWSRLVDPVSFAELTT